MTTEVDDDVFTVSTVEETTKFLISGVKDPETEKIISFDEAIQKKIIDQEKGLYRYIHSAAQ